MRSWSKSPSRVRARRLRDRSRLGVEPLENRLQPNDLLGLSGSLLWGGSFLSLYGAGATTPGGSPDYRGDAISVTGDSASGVPVSSVSALNGLRSERVVSQVVSSPVAATGSSTFQGAADN